MSRVGGEAECDGLGVDQREGVGAAGIDRR